MLMVEKPDRVKISDGSMGVSRVQIRVNLRLTG